MTMRENQMPTVMPPTMLQQEEVSYEAILHLLLKSWMTYCFTRAYLQISATF